MRCGQREWEDFYRGRWQYDKKVCSTHGVNCTGSCSWDEAATLVAASLVHTIQTYGADRIFGFTPISATSMVCYASGARFLSL